MFSHLLSSTPRSNINLIKTSNQGIRTLLLLTQRRITLPHHNKSLHARLPGSLHLLHIITQEQPLTHLHIRPTPRNGLVTRLLRLQPRVEGVKVIRQQRRDVRLLRRVGMLEEQLLRGHGPGRVDYQRDALLGVPSPQGGLDVCEQGCAKGARGVACGPEVALKGFQVGDLHVTGHEVLDVGEEGVGRATVLSREGRNVGGEVR